MAHDAAERDRGGRWRWGLLAALVGGAVLRVLLVVAAPRFGYAWDHFDVIGMGVVASERGLLRVYSGSKDELPVLHGRVVEDGQVVTIQRRCVNPPNYPPIAQVVFFLQSWWLGARDPAFVANTVYTRCVTSLAPWAFELLTAIGVGLLARALTGAPHLGMAAGAATWLAPPLMMNTGLFGQYDAFALAPAVFAVLAMVGGHWVAAGIAVGLGLLSKPQGLLLVPIAVFAALVAAPSGLPVLCRRLLALGTAALLTILIGSAPWMLTDGFAWVERCYRMNLFEVLPYTTLEAFNVWYLLALVTERQPVFDLLTSTSMAGNLTRDDWGRLFLLAALAATAGLCWWRQRRHPALATVLFAGLALWSVFMWPTRVHERYILYCLPFLIAAAAAMPRLRPVVGAVFLIATMEHGWMVWRSGPPLGSFNRAAVERFHAGRFDAYWKGRPMTLEAAKAGPKPEESLQLAFDHYRTERRRSDLIEWAVTLLSLGTYATAMVIVARDAPTTLGASHDDGPPDDVLASA